MITFPTTSEAFIAGHNEVVAELDDVTLALLGYCISIFNGEFYAGAKGEAPSDIVKDAAERFAQMGCQKEFEDPVVKQFYASLQRLCNEAWKQGAARTAREEAAE